MSKKGSSGGGKNNSNRTSNNTSNNRSTTKSTSNTKNGGNGNNRSTTNVTQTHNKQSVKTGDFRTFGYSDEYWNDLNRGTSNKAWGISSVGLSGILPHSLKRMWIHKKGRSGVRFTHSPQLRRFITT